jgi:hypothetical protein
VEYHADDDDDESSCAEEIEKYGCTVPEYFFVAEYNGVKSRGEECGLLYTRGLAKHQLADEVSGKICTNRKYTLILPDRSKIEGTTDENGYIEPVPSPIGEVNFCIYAEEKDANDD